MKTALRLGFLAAVFASSSALGAMEFRASYGNWDFNVSGTSVEGGRQYDFERDLDARRAARRSLELAWDTGPGWWKPDLAYGDAKVGASGSHTETAVVVLPPPLPPTTSSHTTSVVSDFHDRDYVARYPFNIGPVRLAAGVSVKQLDGTIVIEDTSQSQPSRGDYNETFPELHVQARWPAFRWLELQATGQGVQYQQSKAVEWRAGAAIMAGPLLIEALWQEKRYDIEVGEDALDVKLSGALLRAGLVFR